MFKTLLSNMDKYIERYNEAINEFRAVLHKLQNLDIGQHICEDHVERITKEQMQREFLENLSNDEVIELIRIAIRKNINVLDLVPNDEIVEYAASPYNINIDRLLQIMCINANTANANNFPLDENTIKYLDNLKEIIKTKQTINKLK